MSTFNQPPPFWTFTRINTQRLHLSSPLENGENGVAALGQRTEEKGFERGPKLHQKLNKMKEKMLRPKKVVLRYSITDNSKRSHYFGFHSTFPKTNWKIHPMSPMFLVVGLELIAVPWLEHGCTATQETARLQNSQ